MVYTVAQLQKLTKAKFSIYSQIQITLYFWDSVRYASIVPHELFRTKQTPRFPMVNLSVLQRAKADSSMFAHGKPKRVTAH